MTPSTLQALNDLPATPAHAALLRCCGAERWASAMLAARPFATPDALYRAAEEAFAPLREADWLEAFRAHPKIGAQADLAKRFATTAHWASQEQAGVQNATDSVLTTLSTLNETYHARFGFVFLICATGKTAREMLHHLEARIGNDRATELQIAAEEQKKITALRLQKLLGSS